MRAIALYRSEMFSPNMVSNDAAILNAVADELRNMGIEVSVWHEEDVDQALNTRPDIVFTMGRLESTQKSLRHYESANPVRIYNSPQGIENSIRENLTKIFISESIPMPKSQTINLSNNTRTCVPYPFWMKRGSGCAEVKNDVCFISNDDEYASATNDFKKRGITSVVINAHQEGDLIKFYGVAGTDFFDWAYASAGHSKFGLESINGKELGFPFSEKQLKQIADKAAQVLDIPIYGGDCIVSADGTISIIDFNDWPSFSRCRAKAAKAIASLVKSEK